MFVSVILEIVNGSVLSVPSTYGAYSAVVTKSDNAKPCVHVINRHSSAASCSERTRQRKEKGQAACCSRPVGIAMDDCATGVRETCAAGTTTVGARTLFAGGTAATKPPGAANAERKRFDIDHSRISDRKSVV